MKSIKFPSIHLQRFDRGFEISVTSDSSDKSVLLEVGSEATKWMDVKDAKKLRKLLKRAIAVAEGRQDPKGEVT